MPSTERWAAITFRQACGYLPSPYTGTKLYCLVTEAHACEQLAQGCCYLKADQQRFEPAPFWVASERSTVKLAFHDADTDTDADILVDIFATIVARMSTYHSACQK